MNYSNMIGLQIGHLQKPMRPVEQQEAELSRWAARILASFNLNIKIGQGRGTR